MPDTLAALDAVDPTEALTRGRALTEGVLQRMAPTRSVAEPCGRCLIAEGDSWFQRPWVDAVSMLEDRHGYEIESVARAGDTLEDIAYDPGQLAQVARRIRVLQRRGKVPEAILLSAGGNDAVLDHFEFLLESARGPHPGLNRAIVGGLIQGRLRTAYITLLCALGTLTERMVGRKLPVLAHGYGYGVPDGRGYLSGLGPLPGPWLAPAFQRRGYADAAQQQQIVHELIDAFNAMLAGLNAVPGLQHFHHVDVRALLPDHGEYTRWWSDELHPSEEGFERVADALHSRLTRLQG